MIIIIIYHEFDITLSQIPQARDASPQGLIRQGLISDIGELSFIPRNLLLENELVDIINCSS